MFNVQRAHSAGDENCLRQLAFAAVGVSLGLGLVSPSRFGALLNGVVVRNLSHFQPACAFAVAPFPDANGERFELSPVPPLSPI
jgi:hypothetical protein